MSGNRGCLEKSDRPWDAIDCPKCKRSGVNYHYSTYGVCPFCSGRGWLAGPKCERCEGDGRVARDYIKESLMAYHLSCTGDKCPACKKCPACSGTGLPFRWPAVVTQLAEAMYAGEDCGFALHDALLDMGQVTLAEHFGPRVTAADRAWASRYSVEAEDAVRRLDQMPYPTHPKGCWAVDVILGRS